MSIIPEWIVQLEEEDLKFIKRFVLYSGSLKEMANFYEVSYPTLRLRLNRIIQKIELHDQVEEEPYIQLIKSLALDGKMDFDTAKILVEKYRIEKEK